MVKARIVRDDRVKPGGEGVVEMPGEILFVVSAEGVTQGGAEALEDAWGWFIERGLWRYDERGGESITATYRRATLPGEVAARVCCSSAGQVTCLLSPEHFTQGSVSGLQVAVRSSVRNGWRYYASAVRYAARAS